MSITALDRFNRVQILEEDYPDTGALDQRGRPIKHSISVIRVGDGMTLAKYRDTEMVLDAVPVKGSTKGETKMQETEISGIEAAERCCKTNGWAIMPGSLTSGRASKRTAAADADTLEFERSSSAARTPAKRKTAGKPGKKTAKLGAAASTPK